MIKNSSLADNSARNIFCHTWDLLCQKILSLLLNLSPRILNLVKPKGYGCFFENTINTPQN